MFISISEYVPGDAALPGFAVRLSLTAASALFRRGDHQGERGERGAGAAGGGAGAFRGRCRRGCRWEGSLRWGRCSKLKCWWVGRGFSTWKRIRGRRNGRLERAAFSWIRDWKHSEAAEKSGGWEGTIVFPVVYLVHLDQRSVRPLQGLKLELTLDLSLVFTQSSALPAGSSFFKLSTCLLSLISTFAVCCVTLAVTIKMSVLSVPCRFIEIGGVSLSSPALKWSLCVCPLRSDLGKIRTFNSMVAWQDCDFSVWMLIVPKCHRSTETIH